MIFHQKKPPGRDFMAPESGRDQKPAYTLNVLNLTGSLAVLVLLIMCAFLARWMTWPEAADAFIHLTELWVGATAGLFFGERLALGDK